MKKYMILIAIVLTAVVVPQVIAQDDEPERVSDEVLASIPFLPVDAILDDPLEVSNFANDGTATLPIVTSVPVACTIVYGTTPEFGQLSVDQDMDGGTHSDHNPLLSDLEPETLYYFRVQGVDDAGNIYLSETMTFTTPPQTEVETNNLLSPDNGAVILGYSTAFGGAEADATWGIGSAFDGSGNSAWSTTGDGNDAYVEVQLAGRALVQEVEFWTRSMSNDTAQIFAFTVTTDTGDVYGPFELPDADQAYVFEVEFEAETLRFDVTDSNGGNTGAVEIAVYGEFIDD
jgi:hypothetical protein